MYNITFPVQTNFFYFHNPLHFN